MNILIIGHDTFENKGCQALIYTTTRMLRTALPGSTFKVFSWDPEYDRRRLEPGNESCEMIRHRFQTGEFSTRNKLWLYLRRIGIKTDKILRVPHYFYDTLNWADLVVVSGGDILADYGEDAVRHYFFPIAVAEALGKRVYVFAQSISRYKDVAAQEFAKKYLNRAALVTVREERTYEYMRELGLEAPLFRVADPAFTLRPCSGERVEEIFRSEGLPMLGMPLMGISVSRTVTRWGNASNEKFVVEMAKAVDELLEQHSGLDVVFVPHVISREDPGNDDRVVGEEIFRALSNTDRVYRIEGDYNCDELKGVVGRCAVFLGARTHATIAASSMEVPTIALAYSVKAYGIMSDVLDASRAVIDISQISAKGIVDHVNYMLEHGETVAQEMREKIKYVRKQSLLNQDLAERYFGRS